MIAFVSCTLLLLREQLVLSREERKVAQGYEQSQPIDAPPDEVFAWLSDVGNLPEYLPPIVYASVQGASAEGLPGQRIRTTLEYPGEDGGHFRGGGLPRCRPKGAQDGVGGRVGA